MPTHRAIQTAYAKGYAASDLLVIANPYRRRGAAAYRHAWLRGWLAGRVANLPVVAITCDVCEQETLYPDKVDGLDGWRCTQCGFTAPNLELQELINDDK